MVIAMSLAPVAILVLCIVILHLCNKPNIIKVKVCFRLRKKNWQSDDWTCPFNKSVLSNIIEKCNLLAGLGLVTIFCDKLRVLQLLAEWKIA